jgi:hypothetical protein
MAKGNKPRTNVEAGLYAGRKSFSGPDGLPKGESEGADNFPQNDNDQPLKRNSGDVPAARRSAENSRHGLNPAFDSDEPVSTPSPSAAAAIAKKARSARLTKSQSKDQPDVRRFRNLVR